MDGYLEMPPPLDFFRKTCCDLKSWEKTGCDLNKTWVYSQFFRKPWYWSQFLSKTWPWSHFLIATIQESRYPAPGARDYFFTHTLMKWCEVLYSWDEMSYECVINLILTSICTIEWIPLRNMTMNRFYIAPRATRMERYNMDSWSCVDPILIQRCWNHSMIQRISNQSLPELNAQGADQIPEQNYYDSNLNLRYLVHNDGAKWYWYNYRYRIYFGPIILSHVSLRLICPVAYCDNFWNWLQ